MGFLRKQSKAASSILFVDHNNEPLKSREYTSDEVVRGAAHFQLPPGSQFTRATASLRGTITVKTNESAHGSLQPNWRTESIKFLSVGKDCQPRTRSGSEEGIVEVPFVFDMKKISQYSTLEAPLPPSLDSNLNGRSTKGFHKHDGSCSYEVSYTLTITLHSNRGVIASTTEKISLLPLGELDPPSYGSLDVPGEYFTTSSRSPRTKLASRRKTDDFVIDIAGQEPAPLVLQRQSARGGASTKINFILRFTSEEVKPLPNLPQQAHIRAHLATHTTVTPNAASMTDVQRRHQRDPEAQSFSSRAEAQNVALSIPDWNKCKPEVDSKGFAIANLEFLYRLPETGERPGPSFATPLLERRYTLDLKVELPVELGQTLKLSLPVQVLYESRGMRDGLGRKDSGLSSSREIPHSID